MTVEGLEVESLRNLSSEAAQEFVANGAVVVRSFLTAEELDQIDAELEPWLSQIAWSEVMGYALRFGDKWLDHVGIASKTLLRAVVSEEALDFVKGIFGEEPILGEFGLHYSTSPNPELAFHSDGVDSVILYPFLSDMNDENGMLQFVPGTHTEAHEFQFIPEDEVARGRDDIRSLHVHRGDAVFFQANVWHRRLPGKPGRKVGRVMFHPQSHPERAYDLLLRQSFLAGMTPRQLRSLGIGGEAFGKPAHLRHIGREYGRADIRDLITYARRFRRTRLRPSR